MPHGWSRHSYYFNLARFYKIEQLFPHKLFSSSKFTLPVLWREFYYKYVLLRDHLSSKCLFSSQKFLSHFPVSFRWSGCQEKNAITYYRCHSPSIQFSHGNTDTKNVPIIGICSLRATISHYWSLLHLSPFSGHLYCDVKCSTESVKSEIIMTFTPFNYLGFLYSVNHWVLP